MKSKCSENKLPASYDDDEYREIIAALQLISHDMVIAVDEGNYLHIGSIAAACIRHLEFMKQTIEDMESSYGDTRH